MAKRIQTTADEFVGVKLSGDKLTIWIEGRDEYGVSVSGTSLNADQLEDLLSALMVYKVNHFQTRNSSKPDRRQDTRRQGDKTEEKLRQIYSREKCDGSGLVGDVRDRNYRTCNTCGGGGCK